MSKNPNILEKTTDNLAQAGQQLGIVIMATAAVTGLLDTSSQDKKNVIIPSQPIFNFAGETNFNDQSNPIRREKESEESGTKYISYTVNQRTPGRSGKY